MDYGRDALADALAADYVAGTLRAGARRRFEGLLPGHPALRRALRGWEERLLPLTAEIAPVAPPRRIWRGIERRLWPTTPRPSGWQRLGLWRAVAGVATVAALALAMVLVSPPPTQPPIVVVLSPTPQAGALAGGAIVASFSADGRALAARAVTPAAWPRDRALELWSLPAAGAPRSLGLLAPGGQTVVSAERLRGASLGQTAALAVSVEPPGGSPTGQPTGPVVYVGKLGAL